ncbi:branched-chain amino acid ABC transporter permease [Hyphomicrobiales bacterium]|nr:branched-chain amino acid ABC transporter permease [Hyphomicrobiales bacterium]MDC0139788.1 branched-chain amino acid ABC transporter permease [Hyphomicrobiales bacterium]
MKNNLDIKIAFSIMTLLIILVGVFQSWGVALSILNLCLISAVMSMGVNIQWGYSGLINFGVMGFLAIGGLAAVLVSVPPVQEAWDAGGKGILLSGIFLVLLIYLIFFINKKLKFKFKNYLLFGLAILAIPLMKIIAGPSIEAIESIDAASSGFLGGFNLPIIFSWFVGALLAALVALIMGKICLGLRSDYLAISTLLISGIVISAVKHEEWLSRGVKNVIGLKRPVPYEVNLQNSEWFIKLIEFFNSGILSSFVNLEERSSMLRDLVISSSGVFVKLSFSFIFFIVVIFLLIFSEKALKSPWGRMMRAIRDNEDAAKAMGKNVVKRHLHIFMIGSAIIGFSGAMLVTYDGLFSPASYQPLRYTFLIWVMVLVGGTGNNYGAILGGFVVWFIWIESAPFALFLINLIFSQVDNTNQLKMHLIESIPYFRYLMMGLGLLLVMRYRPKGLLPEKIIKN